MWEQAAALLAVVLGTVSGLALCLALLWILVLRRSGGGRVTGCKLEGLIKAVKEKLGGGPDQGLDCPRCRSW